MAPDVNRTKTIFRRLWISGLGSPLFQVLAGGSAKTPFPYVALAAICAMSNHYRSKKAKVPLRVLSRVGRVRCDNKTMRRSNGAGRNEWFRSRASPFGAG
jgi:hypothetical protein